MKREKNEEHLDHLGLYSELPIGEMARGRERLIERLRSERVDAAAAAALSNPAFPRSWRFAMISAAAAAIVLIVVSAMLVQNRAWRAPATGLIAEGAFSRVVGGKEELVHQGQSIDFGETVRSTGDKGGVFTLADGSRIEMRSKSELSLETALDGIRIRLKSGDILVSAAKQRTGHLYVQTKDVTVSVIGTVFMVNAEEQGSRVAVIEGEVRVQQGNIETTLRPGEHVSTVANPESRAIKEEIAWSRQAPEHLALLQQSTAPGAAPGGQIPESAKPHFEEAAIRPCTPEQQRAPDLPAGARGGGNGMRSIQITPGRFYAECMTVAALIKVAHRKLLDPRSVDDADKGITPPADGGLAMGKTYFYGAVGEQTDRPTNFPWMRDALRAGPPWILTDGYTIEAITDGSTDALTMQHAMLWDLLERRFQIKVHVESEQYPILALMVAPGGLKLKPFQEGGCTREKTRFPNPVPKCGQVNGGYIGPNYRLEAGNHVPAALGFLLEGPMASKIIDRTGTQEKFSMVLEFAIDADAPGSVLGCQQEKERFPECVGQPTKPSIHTALSQLGLKLEPIKAPREFIVVDHAERPSPN